MRRVISSVCFLKVLFIFQTFNVAGQIIMPYTIQGFLKDGNAPANGNYDISYTLYETETVGTIVGGNNHLNVAVTGGVFSFTEPAYAAFHTPGRTLWIEFGFKPAFSQLPYTILSPRQRLGAVPFSISSLISLDSLKLGGEDASQYVQTTDTRLSDARPPTAGSGFYIKNLSTFNDFSGDNFWISGTGRANTYEANEYRLANGRRILSGTSDGTSRLYVGDLAGFANGSGTGNSFLGYAAGYRNTTGSGNTFAGAYSAYNYTTGSNNSFFGSGTGELGATGNFNSFFGHRSGQSASGSLNSFFGTGAGLANTSGSSNTFLGHDAGNTTTSGSFNTMVGENTDVLGPLLTNATAIGSKAFVAQSNSMILGSINGVNGATADTNVGIGTTTPAAKFHVNGNVRVTNGSIFVSNPNTLVITSPNGACWGITVNNSGALSTFPVSPCP